MKKLRQLEESESNDIAEIQAKDYKRTSQRIYSGPNLDFSST